MIDDMNRNHQNANSRGSIMMDGASNLSLQRSQLNQASTGSLDFDGGQANGSTSVIDKKSHRNHQKYHDYHRKQGSQIASSLASDHQRRLDQKHSKRDELKKQSGLDMGSDRSSRLYANARAEHDYSSSGDEFHDPHIPVLDQSNYSRQASQLSEKTSISKRKTPVGGVPALGGVMLGEDFKNRLSLKHLGDENENSYKKQSEYRKVHSYGYNRGLDHRLKEREHDYGEKSKSSSRSVSF